MNRACEEIVDFIAGGSTSLEASQFQSSHETKSRVEVLICKEKGEGLLPEESLELNDYFQLEHLMRLVKARARTKLVMHE